MNRLTDLLKQEMADIGYDLGEFAEDIWDDICRVMSRIMDEEDDIRKKASNIALVRKSLKQQEQSLKVELSDLQHKCPHFRLEPLCTAGETVLTYQCCVCQQEISNDKT